MKEITEIKKIDSKIQIINSTLALLYFDAAVNLPKKAVKERARQLSYLAKIAHQKFTSDELFELIKTTKKSKDFRKQTFFDKAYINYLQEETAIQRKLPREFIEKRTELFAEAERVWQQAKEESNYELFKPFLKDIFDIKREQARLIDSKKNPYDVLLQDFEKGMTSKEIDILFEELKPKLIDMLKKLKDKKNTNPKIELSQEKQFGLSKKLFSLITDDKERTSIEKSSHPFQISISPNDVRITTTFKKDPLFSLSSTAHESGHALYEMQISEDLRGTSLFKGTSLGMHESQSKLWEDFIFSSDKFWDFFYDEFKEHSDVKKEDIINSFKNTNITPIRLEADEISYNLHIIIRYEIEKALINQEIHFDDLPDIWANKYEEYLGIKPENDAEGLLQDMHWSGGAIGYFPTYVLGNLYAAMIYNTLKEKNTYLEEEISEGNLSFIRSWLKHNIHNFGATMTAKEIAEHSLNKDLNTKEYLDYLQKKFLE